MTTSTDQLTIRLVREAQMGDREAFAALYRRYDALVYRTAYLLLGDAGRAEELTQDVFVRLYRHLGDYRPDRGAFTTWLHTITVNTCLNARRRRFLSWLSLEHARANEQDLPDAGRQPLDLAFQNEQQLLKCIKNVPIPLSLHFSYSIKIIVCHRLQRNRLSNSNAVRW